MDVQLSDDIGDWIMDGVLVCQVVNKLHPGTINTIHTTTEGQVAYPSIPQYSSVYPNIPQYTPVFLSIPPYSSLYPSIPQYSSVYPSIPQYPPVFLSIPQ